MELDRKTILLIGIQKKIECTEANFKMELSDQKSPLFLEL